MSDPITIEKMSDLRKFVLEGGRLDADTARAVVEAMRYGRVTAAEAAANTKSPSKHKSTKKALTDDELDADLDLFLGKPANPESGGDDSNADGISL